MSEKWTMPEPFKDKPKCSFCGMEQAVAAWSCFLAIYICYDCAVEKLPLLIADATAYEALRQGRRGLARRIEGSLWRGWTHAAIRMLRKDAESAQEGGKDGE